jgi:hypothetical protein
MENIKEFSEQLQSLIKENERLKMTNERLVTQLILVGVNRPDEFYDYDDINKIDLDKVELATSFNGVSVYNKDTNIKIKSYDELPLKEAKASEEPTNTFKISQNNISLHDALFDEMISDGVSIGSELHLDGIMYNVSQIHYDGKKIIVRRRVDNQQFNYFELLKMYV